MRFDNPIYDHGFEFPDLADFPGVESEPRFIDTNRSAHDLAEMQKAFDNNDYNEFLKLISTYTILDKRTRGKLSRFFEFYQTFGKNRTLMTDIADSQHHQSMYELGYSTAHLDLSKIRASLESEIERLYAIEDWRPPIGTMDRGAPINKIIRRDIQDVLEQSGMLAAASKYLSAGRHLKVGSAYLVVGTPTDNHWKQFFYDQTYVSRTTNLHIDPVENQIKVMMYLNTVDDASGPFSFVPRSHRWVYDDVQNLLGRSIATGNYCDTPQKRSAIFKLPRKLRVSYNFGRSLLDTDPQQKIITDLEQSFTSDSANTILFDPAGMHKGGICESKDRIAIQVLLK